MSLPINSPNREHYHPLIRVGVFLAAIAITVTLSVMGYHLIFQP